MTYLVTLYGPGGREYVIKYDPVKKVEKPLTWWERIMEIVNKNR